MEPFGLVRFLQSMLENSAQNQPSDGEKPNTQTPAPNNTQQEQNTPAEKENEKKQDAILAFLDAHEKRAGRVKK